MAPTMSKIDSCSSRKNKQSCGLINDLPEPDRNLIECLFWEDRTEREIAGRLGITQQAVSKRKHRILDELRETLTQTGHV